MYAGIKKRDYQKNTAKYIDYFDQPIPPLEKWKLTPEILKESENIDWFFKDRFRKGHLGILFGEGGIGKSNFLKQLIVSVANKDIKFFDNALEVEQHGKVVCLFAEDDKLELGRFLKNFTKLHQDININEILKNIYFFPIEEYFDINFLTYNSKQLTASKFYIEFLNAIKQIENLQLVVIDTLANVNCGDENSNSHAQTLMKLINYICIVTNANVILTHHKNKSVKDNNNSNYSLRGASAFINSPRVIIEASKQNNNITKFVVTKNNTGNTGFIFTAKFNDDGILVREYEISNSDEKENKKRIIETISSYANLTKDKMIKYKTELGLKNIKGYKKLLEKMIAEKEIFVVEDKNSKKRNTKYLRVERQNTNNQTSFDIK